jgi:prevent-host-death family protein
MRAVGIKTLKNKLSEYVRLASSGETILITDRDVIVAEIGPPDATRERSLPDALLADAVRRGLVTPATMASGPLPQTAGLESLSALLDGLRGDREDR